MPPRPSPRAPASSSPAVIEQRDFETRDGEKRTVFEIIADELGPSLRFATAQIERTERSGGGDRSYSGGGGASSRPADEPALPR